jgi:histidinol phosphatase-like enzyme (inositol monophosphatase family)
MATWRPEMDFAARLAREAGQATLRYFQKGFQTRFKSDASPVTEADLEAERLIRSRIRERFPRDGVLGEEGGEQAGDSGRRWIVDPIDGTKSFVQGVPLFAVLVALEDQGEPVVGAVYLPGLDELVVAARGEGCWWNDGRARVSAVARLEDACAVTTSHRNFERASPSRAAFRERVASGVRLFRGWGDAYGYVLVATGRAELMIDPVINPWDIAPMLPILEEAGGRFSDFGGRRQLQVRDALGTNGLVHEQILRLVPDPS